MSSRANAWHVERPHGQDRDRGEEKANGGVAVPLKREERSSDDETEAKEVERIPQDRMPITEENEAEPVLDARQPTLHQRHRDTRVLIAQNSISEPRVIVRSRGSLK
jgi:hypothetical protein